MPTVRANGLDLFVETSGEGPPVLCVMGLASDSQALAFQRVALQERYRVIGFDNRDAGRSSRVDRDYTVADMAADALGVADALELERFHLLGFSLGSAAAQHVALLAPRRLLTLTLCSTWARFAPAWARLRARTWEREAERGSREELLEEFMLLTATEPLFEDESALAEMKRGALEDPHPQELDALVRQMRAFEHHDTLARLHEIRVPTHVLAGDRDLLIPHWKGQEVAQRIDGATFTLLRGAGHAMSAERAPELNAAVLAFLDANS